jgi:HEAT repeat protein
LVSNNLAAHLRLFRFLICVVQGPYYLSSTVKAIYYTFAALLVLWSSVGLCGISFGQTRHSQNIEALVDGLTSTDKDRRLESLRALEELGPQARTATKNVIDVLNDSEAQVRLGAINTLRAIGPEAKLAITPLIDLVRDRDSEVRRAAAEALASIGVEAKSATPNLLELLRDENPEVKGAGARALGSVKMCIPRHCRAHTRSGQQRDLYLRSR